MLRGLLLLIALSSSAPQPLSPSALETPSPSVAETKPPKFPKLQVSSSSGDQNLVVDSSFLMDQGSKGIAFPVQSIGRQIKSRQFLTLYRKESTEYKPKTDRIVVSPKGESEREVEAIVTGRLGSKTVTLDTSVLSEPQPIESSANSQNPNVKHLLPAEPMKPSVQGPWPLNYTESEVVTPQYDGSLTNEGCVWNSETKSWSKVEVEFINPPGAELLEEEEEEEEGEASKTKSSWSKWWGGNTIVLTGEPSVRLMTVKDIKLMKPIVQACPWTQDFPRNYYLQYLQQWPDLCCVVQDGKDPNGPLMGYLLGKIETGPEGLYGHVSALTVKEEYRKRGVASRLMAQIEMWCGLKVGALYLDLYVKETNTKALQFYQRHGYAVYRTVKGYYGDCAALDMRKSLPADKDNRRMRPKAS